MTNIDTPISLPDLQLARSALRDTHAEGRLFSRVYPRIRKIVWLVMGDKRQTEDVAQLAALEVFKSLDTFKGLGSIEAWAERISYRTALRAMKREKQKHGPTFPFNDSDLFHHETPELSMSRRQMFNRIVSKMSSIPEKRRTPLLLHMAYGYTVREVSQITNASVNTVKARLKVGFRELRAILKDNPDLLMSMEEHTL